MMQHKWLLSVLSGLLLSIAWPYIGSLTPLILIAFVPLLLIEDELFRAGKRSFWSAFKFSYPAFFLFNILTTYWIYNVQEPLGTKLFSAGSAITLNAAFMTIAFALFHVTRSRIGSKEGYIAFVLYWIAWEYMHLNWELSWPWLSLGNVYSLHPNWVQWYEYTGILGGSVLILVANLMLFFAYRTFIFGNIRKAIYLVVVLILVVSVSYLYGITSLPTEAPKDEAIEIVLVQPNVDPYTEKFELATADVQLTDMLELAKTKMTAQTKWVFFPETALQERTTLIPRADSLILIGLWENDIEQSNSLRIIRAFLEDYPDLTLLFGLSSDRLQEKDEALVPASRYIESLDVYYQSYNAAMCVSKDREAVFYHKSELVPAVEFMPFQTLLQPLMDLAIDMGGTTGTLGTQEDQVPFYSLPDSLAISPAICYESIYGEVNGEFVKNGAELLGVITNDGWWGDSPGYKQHVSYARLRAIETRKWVARSANTGISTFIDPTGEVIQESAWWVEDCLVGKVYPNNIVTFYAEHGDYLGRIAAFLSIMLLVFTIVRIIKQRKEFSSTLAVNNENA